MKVGLDAFTIREISTNPIEQLEFAKKNNFDGVQFDEACYLGSDVKYLKDIVGFAEENDLYTSASVDMVDPLVMKMSAQENADLIAKEIAAFAEAGWHELRTRTGGTDDRGPQYRAAAVEVMKLLRPVLKEFGSRINFEDHGECTTFELIRMIEEVGDDIMGINLDTANTLVHAEDPLLAVQRCAPYVHTTHAKDGILFFTEKGVTRQGRPAGQGVVQWDEIIPILYKQDKNLNLSIEDHKWLFEVQIFDKDWIMDHPDLNAYELGQFTSKAWACSRKILAGEMPLPEDYEKTPYVDEMMERLTFARDFLKRKIAEVENYEGK